MGLSVMKNCDLFPSPIIKNQSLSVGEATSSKHVVSERLNSPVGSGAAVGHGQQARLEVTLHKVLVGEFGAVNRFAATDDETEANMFEKPKH